MFDFHEPLLLMAEPWIMWWYQGSIMMTCTNQTSLLQQMDRSIMVVLANESNTATSTATNQGAADTMINTKSLYLLIQFPWIYIVESLSSWRMVTPESCWMWTPHGTHRHILCQEVYPQASENLLPATTAIPNGSSLRTCCWFQDHHNKPRLHCQNLLPRSCLLNNFTSLHFSKWNC